VSAYVGIDVHRKRSQVAVLAGDGKVQLNRNVAPKSQPPARHQLPTLKSDGNDVTIGVIGV
jgi:hypothetical protein